MALSTDKKDRIAEEIKKILTSRVQTFPTGLDYKNRNAPFHDLILTAFDKQLKPMKVPTPYLVAISSWMHGLNTSLGNGFESIAHILSEGYKRKFSGTFILKVMESQSRNIETIIRELKRGVVNPNIKRENDLIFTYNLHETQVDSLGFTVDNYIEKENIIEGIELKSVRPNSGEARGEKQKILYAKAALKKGNPHKDIKYYIGFPFDPTSSSPTSYNKERFFNYLVEFKKFFSPEEVLIAAELWDHLSGENNTMEQIFDIITETIKKLTFATK